MILLRYKNQTDTDIMIEVLREAALRSDKDPEVYADKKRTNRELAVIYDLIEEEYIRGLVVRDGITQTGAHMGGITLKGRLFRDELTAKRDTARWPARLKRVGLVIGGWIVGLLTANAKEILAYFAGH